MGSVNALLPAWKVSRVELKFMNMRNRGTRSDCKCSLSCRGDRILKRKEGET
jgi:hypothetical protein